MGGEHQGLGDLSKTVEPVLGTVAAVGSAEPSTTIPLASTAGPRSSEVNSEQLGVWPVLPLCWRAAFLSAASFLSK